MLNGNRYGPYIPFYKIGVAEPKLEGPNKKLKTGNKLKKKAK